MSARQDRAVELKNRTGDAHYNCAQAVACVFAEEAGALTNKMAYISVAMPKFHQKMVE